MPRMLALALEPSDALVGLLRLKAVIEANRWPREISQNFRTAIEREFIRVEETVRTVGLCYADLEESGVAQINRSPQSRFDDIDGALHLCACPTQIALDLEHLRVAFDRGDGPARESASGLVHSLRTILWYLVRTDMFVCTRLSLNDRDATPERASEFVDSYLGEAVAQNLAPPDPPAPMLDPAVGSRTADMGTPELFSFSNTPAGGENTAVFSQEQIMEELEPSDLEEVDHEAARAPVATAAPEPQAPAAPPPAAGSPFAALSEDARFFLFQADIREKDWPVNRATLLAARRAVLRRLHPDNAGAHSADLYNAADRGSAELLRTLSAIEPPSPSVPDLSLVAAETMQIQVTDVLSDDARFFLAQSRMSWPCDLQQLQTAREALAARGTAAPWMARIDRGYEELRKLVAL